MNCGVELYEGGVLEKYNVKVLGTPVQAIMDTEDREFFNAKLAEINVKTIKSHAVETVEAAKEAAKELGYPVIVRAAYALYTLEKWNKNGPSFFGVNLICTYSDGSEKEIQMQSIYCYGIEDVKSSGTTEFTIKYSEGGIIVETTVTITITN